MIPSFSEGPALGVLVLLATSGLTLFHLLVVAIVASVRKLRRRAQPQPRPPEKPLKLAFVVAVYNDALTIGPCIDSILAQSRRPDQIIVVDDASTDGTFEVLKKYRPKGVQVVRMEANGGKTRALEKALTLVRTDLVAVTDADSIVHRDYVKEIIPSFHDRKVAAVGGAVESIPHTWVTAARQVEYLITLKVDRKAEDAMGTLIVLPGVSSTYRVSVLRKLGFEHDTIAEDFDLTFRMQKAGLKLAMNPRALVYTSDPPTLKAYHRQLTRWYTDLWITVRKHRSMWGKKLFGAVEVPWLALNMVAYSLFVIGFPIYLLVVNPRALPGFFFWEFVADAGFALVAFAVYRRRDVLWSVVSRFPTRIIARWVTLTTLARVLVGRPGMAWTKLERRRTDAFLARQASEPAQT